MKNGQNEIKLEGTTHDGFVMNCSRFTYQKKQSFIRKLLAIPLGQSE